MTKRKSEAERENDARNREVPAYLTASGPF
jgi:hypothetical protein